jgi:alcohol dehydrogenase
VFPVVARTSPSTLSTSSWASAGVRGISSPTLSPYRTSGTRSVSAIPRAQTAVTNGGHPRDWEDFGALRHDPLLVIAIPTTAGTGSEVSPSAVITDTVRKKKMNLLDVRNCPRLPLVDPDLTLSCPGWVTASSGMDALSHAVDSLQCLLATPASDALALEGARLVASCIRRAFRDPSDIEARCGMAQGSLTAGLAVGLTDVSGAPALAEAMGGLYGHPHGYCCAVSMPVIMEYNLDVCAGKYARLAAALGAGRPGASETEQAAAAIGAIRQLNQDLEVPGMAALIRATDLDLLAEKAAANTSNPSNPRGADAAAYPRDVRPRTRVRAPWLGHLAPVDGCLARRVGMALQPVAGEGAQRHDRHAFPRRAADRCRHQGAAEAASLQFGRHLGVEQDEPLAVDPVQKHGEAAIGLQLETGLHLVVGDPLGVAHGPARSPGRSRYSCRRRSWYFSVSPTQSMPIRPTVEAARLFAGRTSAMTCSIPCPNAHPARASPASVA